MLMIYMNTDTWETLSKQEREEVFEGHAAFIKTITESGEMVGTEALANPANSVTVRVRDGVPASTDGPYAEAKEFFCGYYVVDCDSVKRAAELAAMIPDARYTGIEVRPFMGQGGAEI
ncbi:YciI family protein [Streptosporangium carneum]|nr:YciI family protein [Streptosporangium carneum]